ncbi:bromodomain-containing factor 1 [Geosmithia morbida]|uniref:Bromodomain-containing factor 1 n=1 Tax=Geosmithia morbida TaxID=1094350 RepID=A0A9P4YVW1_9HYPO|nr:bromodomain-containing factor 1 [Geosmithia morbida]KAF4121979.1 bromodomain-containing factor 1 [Geosmithia morbida]
MASPVPEAAAPAVDPKPLEGTPSTDLRSQLNGHTPEPTSEAPKTGAVNGAGDMEERNTPTNGVDKESTPAVDTKKTESAEKPTPSASEKEKSAEAQPPTETSKTEEPKDVEMGDTDASEKFKPVKTESESEPAPSKPDESKPDDAASAAPSAADTKEITKEETKGEAEEDSEETSAAPAEKTTETPARSDEKPVTDVDVQPASLSQLAIESTEKGSSPIDVSMTDAPSSKLSREREEDATEEPASKRARTEPNEDEQIADSITAAVPTPPTPPTASDKLVSPADINFDHFPKWNDATFNAKVIQPFQLRDLRKSMARVKKTKNGYHFRDSVQKLWPALWDKYSASVEKPMDLGEIDRNLRDKNYQTFGHVRRDLVLMAENSKSFNGVDHPMTLAAKAAIKSVWDDVMGIPDEEPVKAKPPPKQNRVREPRAAPAKPEITGRAEVAPGGTDGPAAPKPASSAPRKSSVADADRPKRTVRAPKPKDIDYSKPSRKKLKPELQFCDEVLSELMRDKYNHLNKWFNDPVDAEGLGIPHYYSIITHPMDFGKVHKMLHSGDIGSLKEFDKNIQLVFSNCYKFNGPPDPATVSGLAKQLEDIYNAQMKNKESWLSKHAKANPPPSTSVGSDDDDDQDEDEDEDAGSATVGPDPSREVKDLEARLREEMDKQANLFAAEEPNQSMIQIQQGIVNMVQQALLQAKQKLNEYKQKNGGLVGAGNKSKKSKSGNSGGSKSKSSGGGGGSGASRKPGGAAAGSSTKKATGGGGQKKKKNLSATDKDNIANAINDLEYPHLDKAIDIIKRDTGQMESEDGELELDIDQLSHEALLKLWDLCKKVLPGFGKDPAAAAAAANSPEATRGGGPSSKQPKTAARPKKNKPMSAQEQEARIAQLREIRELYKPGQEPTDEGHHSHGRHAPQETSAAMDDSSDDSSEEE